MNKRLENKIKNLNMIFLALGSLPTLAHADCVINTNNLHFNNTSGTIRVESILRSKGYQVVTDKDEVSDFDLVIRYYGMNTNKTIQMIIWNGYPNDIFNLSRNYKAPFGIEGGIIERTQVVRLAKQIPICRLEVKFRQSDTMLIF